MTVLILILLVLNLGVALYAARKAFWAAKFAGAIPARVDEMVRTATQQLEARDVLLHRLNLPAGSLPPSRGWAASPDFLNHLVDAIEDTKAETILDCGSGLTTIVSALYLKQKGRGKVISLDHDPEFAGKTRLHLEKLGLSDFAEIQVAPLKEQVIGNETRSWYDISRIALPESIDLISVDGPPAILTGEEGRYPVGPVAFPKLRAGGLAILDDAARPGEKRLVERLQREFPGLTLERRYAEKGCLVLHKN
jgi:predicted O-methyltransferase YrrM